MLVLSRKTRESIWIDRDIQITVLEVRGNRVRLGIEAPPHIRVARSELPAQIEEREFSLQTA
jgi:carbon storage regulator